MPKSEFASASIQLKPLNAPSGPSEASVFAASGRRDDRDDAGAVELGECRQAIERPIPEQLRQGHSGEEAAPTLKEVDAFENKWFKCTPGIIREYAKKKAYADAIENYLFKGLKDRPCGAAVIGSVSTYLDRVEKLPRQYAGSVIAIYAKAVREGLGDAGLTEERVNWWQSQLPHVPVEQDVTPGEDCMRR